MLRQLATIFRTDDPMHTMGEDFVQMLKLAEDMTTSAGRIFVGDDASTTARARIYDLDVQVNKLERDIRKRIVAHLSIPGNTSDAAHSLLLMSLVKDVERIGDYAKNLSETADIQAGPIPDDDNGRDMRDVRQQVEVAFAASADTFITYDQERALGLIEQCRGTAQRCDELVSRVSRSEYDASTTATLVLGARYYKRINGHLLNVLSSVVMPVYKVDYYDEDEIPKDLKSS